MMDEVVGSTAITPWRYFARVLVWFAVLMAIWSVVGKWTTHPASVIAHMALEAGAKDWVRKVNTRPGFIEVETRLTAAISPSGPNAAPPVRGELSVELNPQHYAYGLPLFLALLFAAPVRGRWWRACAGYVLLLPAQAFSVTLDLLKQMSFAAEQSALGITQWQLEAIAFGYQSGTLMLPTLMPALAWLWLDRTYFDKLTGFHSLKNRKP